MDPFSYLVVLTSIVLGLGVTRLVGGFGNLMQTRRRKRTYWVQTLWMLNLLLTTAIVWWVAYRWRGQQTWNFLLFLWLLLTPTLLYLISALLFPDSEEARAISDWQVYYYENHRDIFVLYALVFPIDLVDTLLKGAAHFRSQGPVYSHHHGDVVYSVAGGRVHAAKGVPRSGGRPVPALQSFLAGNFSVTDQTAVGASLLLKK